MRKKGLLVIVYFLQYEQGLIFWKINFQSTVIYVCILSDEPSINVDSSLAQNSIINLSSFSSWYGSGYQEYDAILLYYDIQFKFQGQKNIETLWV